MSAKAGNKTSGATPTGERPIAQNRRARHDYEILDTIECGMVLVGSEVKSLREGRTSIDEAHGRVMRGEVWLIGCDIPEYDKANQFNHDPRTSAEVAVASSRDRAIRGPGVRAGADLGSVEDVLQAGAGKAIAGYRSWAKTPRQA